MVAIQRKKALAALAQQYNVHPNQITASKAHLAEAAAGLFGRGGSKPLAIDIKTLRAKIGELTLEEPVSSAESPGTRGR